MATKADQCMTEQPKKEHQSNQRKNTRANQRKTHLLAFEVQVQLPLQALAGVHMVPVVAQGGQLLILLHGAVHNVAHPLFLPLQSLHPPHHCQLVSGVRPGWPPVLVAVLAHMPHGVGKVLAMCNALCRAGTWRDVLSLTLNLQFAFSGTLLTGVLAIL